MAEAPRLIIENSNDVWIIKLTGDRAVEQVAIYPDGSVAIVGFSSYKDRSARVMYDNLMGYLQQQGVVITPPLNYKQLQGTIDGILGTSQVNPTRSIIGNHIFLVGNGDRQHSQHPEDKLVHFGTVGSFYGLDVTNPRTASVTFQSPVQRIVYRHFDMRETRIAAIQEISEPQTFKITQTAIGAHAKFNPSVHLIKNTALRGLTRILTNRI